MKILVLIMKLFYLCCFFFFCRLKKGLMVRVLGFNFCFWSFEIELLNLNYLNLKNSIYKRM